MVLTVSFVLSPVIGLICHRRLADTSAKLDASVEASGPHDFAVRLRRRSSSALSASTASRLTSVTIAIRPSWKGGMTAVVVLIWGARETEYFGEQDWTGQISLIRHDK
jgi:hypothetical protein